MKREKPQNRLVLVPGGICKPGGCTFIRRRTLRRSRLHTPKSPYQSDRPQSPYANHSRCNPASVQALSHSHQSNRISTLPSFKANRNRYSLCITPIMQSGEPTEALPLKPWATLSRRPQQARRTRWASRAVHGPGAGKSLPSDYQVKDAKNDQQSNKEDNQYRPTENPEHLRPPPLPVAMQG